jgi:predicted nuclease with TOPRIM domain
MSQETIFIDCPRCNLRMEVEKKTGKVVKTWEKLEKKEGVDPMSEALKKMKEEKSKLNQYFSKAPQNLKDHKEKLLGKFDSEKQRIEKEKDFDRPTNPFDLD